MIDLLIPVAHAAEAAAEAGSTGVAGSLGLSAKLFVAQLVNFGVVLYVLWRWVFTPVSKHLEERRAKIDASLRAAEQVAKDKAEFETWKAAEQTKARREASDILESARAAAVRLQGEELEKTKTEQARLLVQAKNQIEAERVAGERTVREHAAELVAEAASKVLGEKISPEKDRELIERALKSVAAKA